jgi:inhibitor of KinA sporulation pathway (predicted exonuclease)
MGIKESNLVHNEFVNRLPVTLNPLWFESRQCVRPVTPPAHSTDTRKLKEHLGAVVAYMRISKNWDQFMNLLNEHYPRKGETPMLPMDYDQKKDDGKGL